MTNTVISIDAAEDGAKYSTLVDKLAQFFATHSSRYSLVTKSLLVGFGMMLVAGSDASATNYYIDHHVKAASDSNAGTSQTLPWRTLRNISAKRFAPGDVIAIRAGTGYTGSIYFAASGTAEQPITITSYGDGPLPILSNRSAVPYSDVVDMVGANYVVISNLKFSAANNAGIYIDPTSSHITVSDCEFSRLGIGISLEGQYSLFTRNYLHHLKMVVNTIGGVDDYGANGFVVAGPNNEFSYNTCYLCRAPSYDWGTDGGMFNMWQSADNTYIHHNYSTKSDGFLEAGGAGNASALNVRIEHNVSYNNNGNFLTIHNEGYFGMQQSNFIVLNNTIVDTINQTSDCINYIELPPTAQNSIAFYNNVVYLGKGSCVWQRDVPRDNNVYQFAKPDMTLVQGTPTVLGPNERLGNIGFFAPSIGDFRLTASSPARQVSKPVSYSMTDFTGLDILANTVDDVGAYKFSAQPAAN